LLNGSLLAAGAAAVVAITYLLVAHTLHSTANLRIPPAKVSSEYVSR
jgi:hypothetical protein